MNKTQNKVFRICHFYSRNSNGPWVFKKKRLYDDEIFFTRDLRAFKRNIDRLRTRLAFHNCFIAEEFLLGSWVEIERYPISGDTDE